MYPVFDLDLNINKPKDAELYKELKAIFTLFSVEYGPQISLVCHKPNLNIDSNILDTCNKSFHLAHFKNPRDENFYIYFRKIRKPEIKEYLNLYKLFGTSIGEFLSK